MTDLADTSATLPPRMRRALELVYAVDGVIGARVWQWPGRVAIGVSVATAFSGDDTIRRVEVAVAAIRHADEAWDFGLLGVS